MIRICQALDGNPLAIELAAARLRSLTPAQVACLFDDRFSLLTAGSRTALPRHQTLRAIVDWSWDLLDGAERTVLRRLSVFSGGATPAAAEQVCGPADGPGGLIDVIASLVQQVTGHGDRRGRGPVPAAGDGARLRRGAAGAGGGGGAGPGRARPLLPRPGRAGRADAAQP